MRIGTGYIWASTVTSHAPGTMQYISFPSWTATGRGICAVTCSTELNGDLVSTNDQGEWFGNGQREGRRLQPGGDARNDD